MKIITILLAIFLLISCQQNRPARYSLGVANLKVTGKKAALPYFEKGLLLLYSFEYEDAREEFLKAQESDSGMVMAYWGEAMTYNHSLWGEQDYEKAAAALQGLKVNANVESATPLERDFIQAVQTLYKPNTDKVKRDKEYAEYMHEMYEKYPGNQEVAAFYSLALLGSVPEGRDDNLYGQAAVVAQGILKENPRHPGALHYLIHSYDDPDHAQLALTAANAYSKVAPDASHALHMPSHIYVALGMWDEVVSANERSYQASVDRMERKKLDNDGRSYHAYHWLEYGYLQKGRIEDARKMVLDMQQYTTETPSEYARTHMVFLKGTFLVETNLWDSPIADIPIDVSGLNVSVRSQYNFLEGMKAFKAGNRQKLDETIATIKKDCEFETIIVNDAGKTVCLSQTREEASRTDITESEIMETQLRGLRSWLDSDVEQAEQWLKKSAEMEDSLSYSYGPPFIQKPTHELYAEWLVAQQRPEEALEQYDRTLKRATKRVMTLEGKQKAASLSGDESLAQEIAQMIADIRADERSI
jgi:tetratricopeptide (TPR) repeat protein